MYKVIGADGREYGPATVEQLKQWLAENRVNTQTWVLSDGATEWKSLGAIPELAGALPITPPAFARPPALVSAGEQVKGPAIFILVLAGLDMVASVVGLAAAVLQSATLPLLRLTTHQAHFEQQWSLFLGLPANCIGLAISVICLVGALQMLKLKNHGLALATAILMLVPCGGCCCVFNVAAGIWALIVLTKPEVKSAFH